MHSLINNCWTIYSVHLFNSNGRIVQNISGVEILYVVLCIWNCDARCGAQIKLNSLPKRMDSKSHIDARWAREMEICDIYFISMRYSYLYTGISATLIMKSGISFGATFNPPLAGLFRAFTLFIIFGFMYIFSFSFCFISSLFLFLYDSPSAAAPLS